MDCARRSANHLVNGQCTIDGRQLFWKEYTYSVYLFFLHVKELDLGERKECIIEGFRCGYVSTPGHLGISASLYGGSNTISRPFAMARFQETPVYSSESHLERNGAHEVEVLLSSVLHGWSITGSPSGTEAPVQVEPKWQVDHASWEATRHKMTVYHQWCTQQHCAVLSACGMLQSGLAAPPSHICTASFLRSQREE